MIIQKNTAARRKSALVKIAKEAGVKLETAKKPAVKPSAKTTAKKPVATKKPATKSTADKKAPAKKPATKKATK